MVLKSDGTKWACQSCLKGHRVSGCNHTDRELTLVPKKGRPVTQCQHCRLERKKRSAHVSCECGEVDKPHHSKEKCIHLREAEGRAKAGFQEGHPVGSPENDAAHLEAVAEEQGCCCHHGGKCTCAVLKKDVTKDDNSGTPPHGPAVKPRLETTKSEGSITVFQNGHHKPVHRKNHLAHESGMPYKLPTPRACTGQTISAKARRSVDSLALDNDKVFIPSAFASIPVFAPFSAERRLSKSEQPSPKLNGAIDICPSLGIGKLNSMDFRDIGPALTSTGETYTFTPLEPMSGMADSSFDPWSSLPSGESSMGMPNNNPFGVWPTNNDFMGMAQPALTTASSGTQSEVDEIPLTDEACGFGMPSIQEDNTGSFDFSSALNTSSPQSNRRSLPPNFFSASDVMMPNAIGDWQQSQFDDINATAGAFQKSFDAIPPANFDDVWQMSEFPSTTDLPHRQLNGNAGMGRPASQSVGPSNAPPDDLIRQLFPDIEPDGSLFSSIGNTDAFGTGDEKDLYSANATSAPMDFGPMDEVDDFTTQAWTDGSMIMPSETFSPSYGVDHAFSGIDFNGNWRQ
ncbi:hypothetical protein LTR36_006490 [Oleoguttula mirabilis]|uniref:Copper-fist domain-containing protein n=1 Tax=Oleoguttula mirabilis TaxID=1507867 RepID=A0AAV9JXX6_9PEZI|nr:hypothetical protein LTR36_006490 [Oleoguttula mirabilis]